MRFMDFSSWQGALLSILALSFVMLIGVGIRVLMMLTIQQRQQRANRQINERLRTLISAYKVLGGSFTGNLHVDPAHLRDLREKAREDGELAEDIGTGGSDRSRRIRDAVEAALSDIILLGDEDQVRMAAKAASNMATGQTIQTAELVISLRNSIREALDLAPVPPDAVIPAQGPTRQQGAAGRGRRGEGSGSGRGGGMADGGGLGMGLGLGGRNVDNS